MNTFLPTKRRTSSSKKTFSASFLRMAYGSIFALLLLMSGGVFGQINIPLHNTDYNTNFNGWNGTTPTGFTNSGGTYQGTSATGGTGGLYAVTSLGYGYQGSGSLTSTTLTGSYKNTTGNIINSLTISYDAFRINHQASRIPTWTVSSTGLGSPNLSSLTYTYANNATVQNKTITLTGLNIANNATFEIIFTGERGGGSGSVPKIGLNNVKIKSNFVAGFTVTFDKNAADATGTMANQTASSATNLTSNAFSRTNYAFTGWNTIAVGGGDAYANNASYPFTASTTLYAQWTPITTTLANNSTPIAAGNITAGTTNNILASFMTTQAGGNVTLSEVNFLVDGTYVAADISAAGFKLYTNTTNSFVGATQVGSGVSSASAGSGDVLAFTGLTQNLSVGQRYFWITADVSAGASSHNLYVAGINNTDLVVSTGTKSGSSSDSGLKTIIGAVTTLAYNGSAVAAGDVTQGTNNNILASITLTQSGTNANLTSASFLVEGTFVGADINGLGLKLHTSATNDFGTATVLASMTSTAADVVTFSGFSQTLTNSATRYFWVTANIAIDATPGHTINVDLIKAVDFIVSQGTVTGANTAVSGVKTIIATAVPTITVTPGTLTDFGSVCLNTDSTLQSYTLTGVNLTTDVVVTAPAGFKVRKGVEAYASSTSVTPSSGNVSTTIDVIYSPTVAGASGTLSITNVSTGAVTKNVSVSGTGLDTTAGTVTVSAATLVTAKTATLNGEVTAVGVCPAITEKGFVYSVTATNATPAEGGTGVTKAVVAGTSTGTYTSALTGLLSSTQYSVRAYVYNGTTYTYSASTQTFTTSAALVLTGTLAHGSICPTLSTTPITYTITNNGAATASDIVVGSSDPQFVVSALSATSIISGGTATYQVTFTPSSAGAKSAVITVSSSSAASATNTVTGTGTATTLPTVTVSAATSVTAKTATLNGNVTNVGICPAIIERGFVYSITSVNGTPAEGGTGVTKAVAAGISTGAYTSALTGLLSSTQYSVRAYVYNGTTYTYSASTQTFTTSAALVLTGTLAHGSICPTFSTSPVTYTITNNGATTASDLVVGSSDPQFVVSALSSTSIISGGTATYQVTFTPSSTGAKSAVITVSSSSAASATNTATGTGAAVTAQAIATNTANGVGFTTATLRTTSTTFGTCPATTAKGFVYALTSLNPNPEMGGSSVINEAVTLGTTGAYTKAISGLTSGVSYSYQSYLYNGTTYTYGGVQTFTTLVPLENDDCTGAVTLTANAAPLAGSFLGATQSIADNCGGSPDEDVWYVFTTTGAATYTINIVGSSGVDPVIDLREGACNGTSISCVDLFGTDETMTIALEGSTTYYIRIYDYEDYIDLTTYTFTIELVKTNEAPVATAATSIGESQFVANWNAVAGATSYELDIFQEISAPVNTLETFTSIGGGATSSYLTRSWTGNGGIQWTAYKSRTDQVINSGNNAITLQDANGSYLQSGEITGNPTQISFDVQRKFGSGTGAVIVKILNGAGFATSTTLGTYSFGTSVEPISIPVTGITGPFKIVIESDASQRPCIDNLSFTTQEIVYILQDENVGNVTSYIATGLEANTTYSYVVRANEGATTSPNSNKIDVTTLQTVIWNGTTWSNIDGPSELVSAVIDGDYNTATNGEISALSLTVNLGYVLTIAENFPVTVVGSVTVNTINNDIEDTDNGLIYILNNGSLVQITDVDNAMSNNNIGAIKMQRITQPMYRQDYTYWSSPIFSNNDTIVDVGEFTLKMLSDETPNNKFFQWNPNAVSPSPNWAVITGGTKSMNPGKGYIIRAPQSFGNDAADVDSYEEFDGYFYGKPNNGIISTPISGSDTENKWNLIGNPYPSAIDAEDFVDANNGPASGNDILGGTLYFWTHNSPFLGTTGYSYSTADYAAWNSSGGTATEETPEDDEINNNNATPLGRIAAGQGFFVKGIANGSVIFNNSMRRAAGNNQFFKSNPVETANNVNESSTETLQKSRVWLNLKGGTNGFSQTLVGYITNATNDFDTRFDGPTFGGNSVTFYSINNAKNLTIQGRALPFVDTDEVPMGYKTTLTGNLTISIDHKDGSLENQNIYLKDNVLNVVHNLNTSAYTFAAVPGTFNDRFVLRYLPAENLDNPTFEDEINGVTIRKNDAVVSINSPYETIDEVLVYDIMGRLIFEKKECNSPTFETNTLTNSDQVLIVKVKLNNGGVVTKKVF